MKINLEIFKQSLEDLSSALPVYKEETELHNKRQFLAGAVQMFSYTYEMALKTIRRALYIQGVTPEELIALVLIT